LIAGLLFYVQNSVAQERCGTVEYQKQLHQLTPKLESTERFEDWMSEKIFNKKHSIQAQNREEATIVTIPVVVHIIHNGEPVGTGINISDNQIISQMEVLNEDFRRLNDDRFNTPSTFEPVAADIEIEFALAVRDPEGLPTDGILRVDGNRSLWELSDNNLLKSQSYWPSDDYFNIWVTDLGSSYLGYAQFPISTLQGLEGASNNALTDGVVIDYFTFGSKLKIPSAILHSSYDRGRTVTHEVGHFFGLRHIWGDGGCSVDDFCNDTPLASQDHVNLSDCTFPGPNTCSTDVPDLPDMFQNYMDYTDDVCMNIFTLDQKTRMRTVLDNSPRRASLVTSKGSVAPVSVTNDIGVRKVLSPIITVCGDTFKPEIEIRNYGTNSVSNFSITFKLNGNLIQTYSANLSLAPLDISTIVFNEVAITGIGDQTLTFEVISVNSTTDNNIENDKKEVLVTIPPKGTTPTKINFSPFPSNWTISNIDDASTWENGQVPNGEANNMALGIQFYNYENIGEVDLFSSPVFDLSTSTTAKLSFDVAYAKYSGTDDEGLIVTIAQNCASATTDTIYYKLGDQLKTVNSESFFTPSTSFDWRKETIDLAPYLGQNAVQIHFIAKNGYGNNLYLDNIELEDVENKIVSPSPSSCNPSQVLTLEVANSGSKAINNFDIQYSVDGGTPTFLTFNLTDPLEVGFSTRVSTSIPDLAQGGHTLEVTINLPSVLESIILNHNFYIDQSEDIIPIRENFEDFKASSWQIANHDQDVTWQLDTDVNNKFLSIDNANYKSINQNDWFISPSLDFTKAATATLTFDVAYSSFEGYTDGLTLYISTDCGENFSIAGYNKIGDELATANFQGVPDASQWRLETVDLSLYLGFDEVRLAFVSTNKNGNNIYLDDIQIFVTDFIPSLENNLFPNPTVNGKFNIAFDLNKKEQVKVMIYDLSGHQLVEETLENTLNQQYTFDISNQPQGIYIVRAVGESFTLSRRVMKND
jgi:hypothetical protein